MSSYSSDSESEIHEVITKKLKSDSSQSQQLATASIEIPFKNRKLAEIAFNSLSVDKGPKGEIKDLLIEDNKLICKLKALDARSLRISANSFLDFTNLVCKTIERFDEE